MADHYRVERGDEGQLYVYFPPYRDEAVRTVELALGVELDINEDGTVAGIEILCADAGPRVVFDDGPIEPRETRYTAVIPNGVREAMSAKEAG